MGRVKCEGCRCLFNKRFAREVLVTHPDEYVRVFAIDTGLFCCDWCFYKNAMGEYIPDLIVDIWSPYKNII